MANDADDAASQEEQQEDQADCDFRSLLRHEDPFREREEGDCPAFPISGFVEPRAQLTDRLAHPPPHGSGGNPLGARDVGQRDALAEVEQHGVAIRLVELENQVDQQPLCLGPRDQDLRRRDVIVENGRRLLSRRSPRLTASAHAEGVAKNLPEPRSQRVARLRRPPYRGAQRLLDEIIGDVRIADEAHREPSQPSRVGEQLFRCRPVVTSSHSLWDLPAAEPQSVREI